MEAPGKLLARKMSLHQVREVFVPENPFNDITPDIFRHLLHYIYGGTVEEDDLAMPPT